MKTRICNFVSVSIIFLLFCMPALAQNPGNNGGFTAPTMPVPAVQGPMGNPFPNLQIPGNFSQTVSQQFVRQPYSPSFVPQFMPQPLLPCLFRPIVYPQLCCPQPTVKVSGKAKDFVRYKKMLLGFQPNMEEQFKAYCKQVGLNVQYVVPGSLGVACCSWPEKFDIKKALEQLQSRPDLFRYVEPNITLKKRASQPWNRKQQEPYRPTYKLVAYTKGDAFPGQEKLWGMERIHAPEAWEITTASDVGIAVLDTGLDWSHPALKTNVYHHHGVNPLDTSEKKDDVVGVSLLRDDDDTQKLLWEPTPNDEHGTHVAGSIGSESDETVGVLWNCKMLPVKIFYADPETGGQGETTDVGTYALGIQYILEANKNPENKIKVKVINMSFGADTDLESMNESLVTSLQGSAPGTIRTIFEAARDAGILIVCAAGNSGSDQMFFPACLANTRMKDLSEENKSEKEKRADPNALVYPNMLVVAALSKSGKLWEKSNYGKSLVQIAAPGEDIFSTTSDNKYDSKNGTSMAAPYVAGAAALLWGLPQYKQCSSLEIKQLLLDNAAVNPELKDKVAGEKELSLEFVKNLPLVPKVDNSLVARSSGSSTSGSPYQPFRQSPSAAPYSAQGSAPGSTQGSVQGLVQSWTSPNTTGGYYYPCCQPCYWHVTPYCP